MTTDATEVTRDVRVAKMVEPDTLSLVKRPANQVGFKIVRSDEEEQVMTEQKTETRIKRVRAKRSMGPMMGVMFPAGMSEEDAKAKMAEYGMSDYTMVKEGDNLVARRSDLAEIPANSMRIGIGDGIKAVIENSAPAPVPGEKQAISVVAIRFDKEQFAEESAVMEWIERHDIDFLENGVKNDATAFTVTRSEVSDETREIEAEGGVTFVVARADAQDIPQPFVEVVSETAYGSWGWGHLDFAAAMADYEFSDVGRDAVSKLEDVLRNIMFYSPLPVAVRKELVNRALSQFGTFIGGLLDALPTKVVMVTRSIMESKENQMTNEVQKTGSAQTEDGAKDYVTRADLTAAVTAAVTAALAQQANVQRSDEQKPEQQAQTETPAAAAMPAGFEAVTRSMETMAETMKSVAEKMDERMTKLEGMTVVRSDKEDGKEEKVERKDVFKGVFGNLGRNRGE